MENNSDQSNTILEEEKKILLDHDYDGIQELDHPLPLWWVGLFVATIVFSIPYWFYYHHFDGPSLVKVYQQDMQAVMEKRAEFEALNNRFDLDKYNSFIMTEEAKKLGSKTYRRKCQACHGDAGQGGIGPNLTDKFWLNGDGSIQEVYKVVDKGVPDKGMAAWGETLNENEMMAVVGYVMEFKGTNPAGAKGPQGQEYP